MIDTEHYSITNNMHLALRVCTELGVDPYDLVSEGFGPSVIRWKIVARDLVIEAVKLRAMGLNPYNVVL